MDNDTAPEISLPPEVIAQALKPQDPLDDPEATHIPDAVEPRVDPPAELPPVVSNYAPIESSPSESSNASLLDAVLSATSNSQQRARTAQLVEGFREQAKLVAPPAARSIRQTLKFWIAQLDQKLTAQVNVILHEPEFQAIEGTWRGLEYLVRQTEMGDNVKIRALNITKKDLFRDLEKAVEFDMSQLFKKVYTEEYGQLGGEPYGILIGDFEFSRHPEDIALLKMISNVAAAAHSPFVSAANAQMFNLSEFAEMAFPINLDRIFASEDYIPWKSFRSSDDSRYVALTLPRVLARLPYREGGNRCKGFHFEEDIDGRSHEKYCWMNAAWAYAGRVAAAFSRYGWMARVRGIEGGGRVDDLPVSAFSTDSGELAVKGPVEIDLSDKREFELSKCGFLPLVHARNTSFAVFAGAQTCQDPVSYHDANATANAELSTKLNYILCVSRFAHFLKVMARYKIGQGIEVDECERELNDWLQKYVNPSPEMQGEEGQSQQPLREAKVEVRAIKSRPGFYQTIMYLRPHYQLEAVDASVRLIATVPKKS